MTATTVDHDRSRSRGRVTGPGRRRGVPRRGMPELYNALHVRREHGRPGRGVRRRTARSPFEVAQHIGATWCAPSSCSPPTARGRGTRCAHRRRDPPCPSATVTLGHVWNHPRPSRSTCRRRRSRSPTPRHPRTGARVRPAREQDRGVVTGIKVIDLLTPYVKGGKFGLFGGAGRRQDGAHQEMINPRRRAVSVVVGVRGVGRAHP